MRRLVLACLALPAVVLFAASPALAQDGDAMAKWAAASVVHYRLVGNYEGEAKVLRDNTKSASAPVTDHVEIEFDWNQMTYTMAGKPVIRNAPSKLIGAVQYGAGCPPPRVDGTFEFATVANVTAASTRLEFESKQEWPGGSLPSAKNLEAGGRCGEIWTPADPGSETTTFSLDLPPAMLVAAPGMGGDIEVTKDGKSLLVKASSQTDGWAWTITPTIVK